MSEGMFSARTYGMQRQGMVLPSEQGLTHGEKVTLLHPVHRFCRYPNKRIDVLSCLCVF